MIFDRSILQKYAKQFESSPSSLPPTLLLINTETSLTLFDKYPKAIYHFLVLPRILPNSGFAVGDLSNLQTLFARGKQVEAKALMEGLKKDAEKVKEMVEEEMIKRHGYKWGVWIGFHAIPSLVHLHLHVISSDLFSPTMKHKKHYNSFRPELGFFLHMSEVLSWLEGDGTSFDNAVASLQQNRYELLLKEDLKCWRCREVFKTFPKLKEHLTREKEAEASREKKARQEKERNLEDGDVDDPDRGEPGSKGQAVTPCTDT